MIEERRQGGRDGGARHHREAAREQEREGLQAHIGGLGGGE